MSHIFTLENLARYKVSLEFTSPGQPPSIHWRPLNCPITLHGETSQPLSIRVNESFVNGRPSLTLFLVRDPESAQLDHPPFSDMPLEADLSDTQSSISPRTVMENDSESGGVCGEDYAVENGHLDKSHTNVQPYSKAPDSTTSLDFVFSPSSWPSDSTMREELSSESYRNSPTSTTPMENLTLGNDTTHAALLTSLMSLDMLFGDNNTTVLSWSECTGHPSTSDSSAPSPVSPVNQSLTCTNMSRSNSTEGGVKRSQGVRHSRRNSLVPAVNRSSSTTVEANENPRRGPNVKGVKKRVKCSLCNETFSRRHDMMRHEASQHGKVQEWTCERCRRFFSSEAMLSLHRCPALRPELDVSHKHIL